MKQKITITSIFLLGILTGVQGATWEEMNATADRAVKLAGRDPAKAAGMAGAIEDRGVRDKAIAEIARSWVESSPDAAAKWALEIEGPDRLDRVRSVLMAWAATEPAAAARWAETLDADKKYGYRACIQVAGQWMKSDEAAARKWVRSIKDADVRMMAMESIGWKDADLQSEEKQAMGMNDPAASDRVLEALARGYALKDHARAEKLARGIEDEAIRHDALFYLAITFPAKDLERALAIARSFEDKARQDGTLASIVTTCANAGDFEAATTVAQSIGEDRTRIERLEFVLRQVLRKDEKAGKAWYDRLPADDRTKLKSEYDYHINPPWKLREAR